MRAGCIPAQGSIKLQIAVKLFELFSRIIQSAAKRDIKLVPKQFREVTMGNFVGAAWAAPEPKAA